MKDVVSLHQILMVFSKEIFELFNKDITKYPTISSLAFAIYRSNFMESEDTKKIPLIYDNIYEDIKKSYHGGFVETYKPFSDNVYSYDIVSLYPSRMKNCPLPIGNPTYIGDNLNLDDFFGFFYAEIESPKSMRIPILQVNNNGNILTPLGKWSGWYFSEELKNAKKYGYTVKIIKGWFFVKGYIFSDYIDSLFSIKNSSVKNDPKYLISKLLMNSLYGRMGMSPFMENHEIIHKNEEKKYLSKKNIRITNILDFKNGYVLISFESINKYQESSNRYNVSVPIAAAISSWSRIKMSHFLNKYSNNILCVDTDGIKVNCELSGIDVGDNLGDMKYEFKFKEFVSLAPKVYGGLIEGEEEIVKIKGLKNPLPYFELKSLLKKDSKLVLPNEKWYRHLDNGYIQIKNETYTLMITENKREIIYNDNNLFIDTKPFVINDNFIVKGKMLDLIVYENNKNLIPFQFDNIHKNIDNIEKFRLSGKILKKIFE
uniref:DNA-directed DNA polymerase n=1 Tax=Dactylella sp. TaxID=1814903 RepID=A0A482DQT8_9PEZI|nr:hypothetical protein [Dactylella sp.]